MSKIVVSWFYNIYFLLTNWINQTEKNRCHPILLCSPNSGHHTVHMTHHAMLIYENNEYCKYYSK